MNQQPVVSKLWGKEKKILFSLQIQYLGGKMLAEHKPVFKMLIMKMT